MDRGTRRDGAAPRAGCRLPAENPVIAGAGVRHHGRVSSPYLSALHVYPVKSIRGTAPGEAAVEPWGLAGDRRWMLVDDHGRFVSQRRLPRLALVGATPLGGGGLRVESSGWEPLTVAAPEPGRTRRVRVWRDEVEVVPADPAAGEWFSAFLGTEVRMVYLDDPALRRPVDPRYAREGETVSLADGFPLLVTASASLTALNALVAAGDHPGEGPLPMDRFRPNLVVDGTEPWAEDGWRRLRVGPVVFRVAKPCARCVITTTDQQTGARGTEPLRALGGYRPHRPFGKDLVFGQNLVPENLGTLRVGDPVAVLD